MLRLCACRPISPHNRLYLVKWTTFRVGLTGVEWWPNMFAVTVEFLKDKCNLKMYCTAALHIHAAKSYLKIRTLRAIPSWFFSCATTWPPSPATVVAPCWEGGILHYGDKSKPFETIRGLSLFISRIASRGDRIQRQRDTGMPKQRPLSNEQYSHKRHHTIHKSCGSNNES